MEYLIRIVPPKEIGESVCELRVKWGYEATEPHFTIKTPEGLNKVEKVVYDFKAFDISLSDVGFFNQSVLFYEVHSKRIRELHNRLVRTIYPFKDKIISSFELDNSIPHLTIMKHKTGFDDLPLQDIARKSKQMMKEEYTFTTKFIRIYSRHNSKENSHKYHDVYFT